MILPLQDGVILTSETDSDDLVKWTDTNGDGVADKREVVFTGIGQSGDANIEHQKAGLLWNMDNWIYTTYNPFRIRWTPSGFLREPTGPNGGQWGLASDDDGKPWFVDAGGERGPMNFQFPIHYGAFTPCPAAGRPHHAASAPAAAAAAARIRTARRGWRTVSRRTSPSSGRRPGIGDMQGGIGRTRMPAQNLNHFTAATGPGDLPRRSAARRPEGRPALHRAGRPSDSPRGDRQHRRADAAAQRLSERGVHDQRRSAVPAGEHQQRAGRHALHRRHVSRHHPGAAVVRARAAYLRAKIEQYQLDKVAAHGRIWRLRYDGRAGRAGDRHQHRPAGDSRRSRRTSRRRRCTARRRRSSSRTSRIRTAGGATWRSGCSILKQDKSVVPALEQMVADLGQPARALPRAVDARRARRARRRRWCAKR